MYGVYRVDTQWADSCLEHSGRAVAHGVGVGEWNRDSGGE